MSANRLVAARVLEPLNPATLLPVGTVPVTEPTAVAEAVAEAQFGQHAWGVRPFGERSRLLRAVAAVLLEGVEGVAATVVAETGKPVVEATTTEIFVALDNLVWLARNAGTS